jgi:hypothetical protein
VFNHTIGRITTSGANDSSPSMTSPVALPTARWTECFAVGAGLPRKDEHFISPCCTGETLGLARPSVAGSFQDAEALSCPICRRLINSEADHRVSMTGASPSFVQRSDQVIPVRIDRYIGPVLTHA